MTELCDIAYKYGTDKCPQIKHHFTEFYHGLFGEKREQVRKVVEIGIGQLAPKNLIGASLLMWRDYFPRATIYGADIDLELLFEQERIETVYCNQTKQVDLEALLAWTGRDVDLFVDDGLHTPESQVFTAQVVRPLLAPETLYVIEDAGRAGRILAGLSEFPCEVWRPSRRRYNDDTLVVVGSRKA